MSVTEWGINLYGVNLNELDFKDGKNNFIALAKIAEDNDYEFEVVLDNGNVVNLSYIALNDGDCYLGYQPNYPWLCQSADNESRLTSVDIKVAIHKVLKDYIIYAARQIEEDICYFNLIDWG